MSISRIVLALTLVLFGVATALGQRPPPTPDPGTPVKLLPVASIDQPFISGNNVLDPGLTNAFTYTQQSLIRGSWIEATLTALPNDSAELGVVPPWTAEFLRSRGVGWPLGTFYSGIELSDFNADGINELTIYHGLGGPGLPTIVYNSGNLPGNPQTVQIRIAVGNRLYYYRDYVDLSSVPLYESPDIPPTPLVGFAICITINNAGCQVREIRKGRTLLIQ